MGSCLDRLRNQEEGYRQIQSSSTDQNQVTGNTCSSGSEDPGDRNIEGENTKMPSSNKESTNTREINSGESKDADGISYIIEREGKDLNGDIKEGSSSGKQSLDTDRNIEEDNTKKPSSGKKCQNTGEIHSQTGESKDEDDIIKREEKDLNGDIKEGSSSGKQSLDTDQNIEEDNTKKSSPDKESQDTREINLGESQDAYDREEKSVTGDIKEESSSAKQSQDSDKNIDVDNTKKLHSDKESPDTRELNTGKPQDAHDREEKSVNGDTKEELSTDKESQDTGEINARKSQDADDREEKSVNGDTKEESSSAKQSQDTEINLIVLSPLPEGVKRFYKALEQKLPKVRISEVPVNDFMDDRTGNNLVIVICNITTRALSDVTATLDKIKDDMRHRIFLICLHGKNPTEAAVSAAKNIVKRNFPSIKRTVDMAYYRIKDIEGLHTCELNTKALETIENHIKAGDFTTK